MESINNFSCVHMRRCRKGKLIGKELILILKVILLVLLLHMLIILLVLVLYIVLMRLLVLIVQIRRLRWTTIVASLHTRDGDVAKVSTT